MQRSTRTAQPDQKHAVADALVSMQADEVALAIVQVVREGRRQSATRSFTHRTDEGVVLVQVLKRLPGGM